MAIQVRLKMGGGKRIRAAVTALIILGTSLFIVLSALAIWRGDLVTVFLNDVGVRPASRHLWFAAGLLVAFWVIAALMTVTFDEMRDDVSRQIEIAKAKSTPPPSQLDSIASPKESSAAIPGHTSLTPKQHVIAAYTGRHWQFNSRLSDDPSGPEVWIGPAEPDEDGWKRTSGAVIYEDGEASQFSALVLTNGDVWALGNEQQILRQQINRPVALKTVLGKPLVRRMISTHDYVLGVGLASSSPAPTAERNDQLSMARGYNIAYAVSELKLLDPSKLGAASFGHATQAPSSAEQEPLQRSVVVVGINASRAVIVADIMDAVARLIQVDGVVMENYTHAGAGHLRMKRITAGEGYLKPNQINLTGVATDRWVLAPVEPRK